MAYYFYSLIRDAVDYFHLPGDAAQYHLSMSGYSVDNYQTIYGARIQSGTRLALESDPRNPPSAQLPAISQIPQLSATNRNVLLAANLTVSSFFVPFLHSLHCSARTVFRS